MKVGIAGSGAVGGLFGGLLHQAGHEVTFLARGKHLDVMKSDGLMISGSIGELSVQQFFTDKYSDLHDVDIILFCVKSPDTLEMAKRLKNNINERTLVITMQNGVDNEEILVDIFGKHRVFAAATYVQAKITSPGKITQDGRVRLLLGALDDENNKEVSRRIANLFYQANVDAIQVDDVMKIKWEKLIWNITFNPLSAIVYANVGQILDNIELRKIAKKASHEALLVGEQLGYKYDKDTYINELFINAEIARNHTPSMLQDRMLKKKMEIESICGYVIEQGKSFQIKTPTLVMLYNIIQTFDNT